MDSPDWSQRSINTSIDEVGNHDNCTCFGLASNKEKKQLKNRRRDRAGSDFVHTQRQLKQGLFEEFYIECNTLQLVQESNVI